MTKETGIKLFEEKQVRAVWDDAQEKWYISRIDVIEMIVGSQKPRKQWNARKTKLKNEESELSHKLGQMKVQSADGKCYLTDVADTSTKYISVSTEPKDFKESNQVTYGF